MEDIFSIHCRNYASGDYTFEQFLQIVSKNIILYVHYFPKKLIYNKFELLYIIQMNSANLSDRIAALRALQSGQPRKKTQIEYEEIIERLEHQKLEYEVIIAEKDAEISFLQADKIELKANLSQIENENANLNKNIKKISSDKNNYQKELSINKQIVDNLQKDNEEKTRKIIDMEHVIEEFKAEQHSFAFSFTRLKEENQLFLNEKEKCIRELNSEKVRIIQLEEELKITKEKLQKKSPYYSIDFTHSKYYGQIQDNKANGYGVFVNFDGSRYFGELKDNKKEGYGIEIFTNGQTYIGYWKNDDRNGNCSYIWPSGHFYMGEFSNNHLNGKGMQIYPSGHIYTGIFANSKKEGIGKLINPDGTIHDGKFKDDLFIGK